MKYYSLTDNSNTASFSEAVIRGLAPDRGLYFPEKIPILDASFLADITNKSMVEIGIEFMRPFVGGTIPEGRLEKIIADTLCFDFPVNKINDNTATLELFHGPTMAFKDVGARFMARCIGYFNEQSPKKVTVLVATSGDTGGAVALDSKDSVAQRAQPGPPTPVRRTNARNTSGDSWGRNHALRSQPTVVIPVPHINVCHGARAMSVHASWAHVK